MFKSPLMQLIFVIFTISYGKIGVSGEITGIWNSNDNGKKIQIHIDPCHNNINMLCAKISSLELAAHHQPYLDRHNPDQSLQNRPLIGLEILRGLVVDPDTPDAWINGDFYNPEDGDNYSCSIKLVHNDKGEPILKTRIFIGIELIGKTRDWTR